MAELVRSFQYLVEIHILGILLVFLQQVGKGSYFPSFGDHFQFTFHQPLILVRIEIYETIDEFVLFQFLQICNDLFDHFNLTFEQILLLE